MIRIFTVKFDRKSEMFDESPVNDFIMRKSIMGIKSKYFNAGDQHYWSVYVEYEDIIPETAGNEKGLNEWQNILFQKMKEWRKNKSEEEGIPVFLVATNRELRDIVKEAPNSIESLKGIRGFGRKKVAKYGKELIEMIRNYFNKK